MPINMCEATHEECFYQLERCEFALTTMMAEIKELFGALDDDTKEWPEEADFMLNDIADAIGEADDKVCEIVSQIRQYFD